MVMKIDLKKLIKNLAIPLAVGLISGFLTRGGVEEFNKTADKPFFMPPSILFPIAWTILYVFMGIATYLIEIAPPKDNKPYAMKLFYIQLGFNFLWSFIFFSWGSYLLAFLWLIAMLILIVITTLEFHKIEPKAAYFMIPYIIWVAFAAVLNFSVYLLN
jgi:tryptophan-rich sensory protein